MIRSRTTALSSLCILLFVTLPLYGAENEARPEFTVRGSLSGAELPAYYHYRTFISIASGVLDDPSPEIRRHFFETSLGLPPKPEVVTAVRKAVLDGSAVLAGNSPSSRSVAVDERGVTNVTVTRPTGSGVRPEDFQNEAAYRQAIQRSEREKARGLGRVIGELEAAMDAQGIALATFHAHITGEMGGSVSMVSSEELTADHHVWQLGQSFEAGRHAGYMSATEGK